MRMAALRHLCVGNFRHPAVRDQLMTGLEAVASWLRDSGAYGDLWVNGSFLTKTINPRDIDVVMAVPVDGFRRSQSVYEWLNQDLKPDFGCDTYFFRDHRRDQTMREYWMTLPPTYPHS